MKQIQSSDFIFTVFVSRFLRSTLFLGLVWSSFYDQLSWRAVATNPITIGGARLNSESSTQSIWRWKDRALFSGARLNSESSTRSSWAIGGLPMATHLNNSKIGSFIGHSFRYNLRRRSLFPSRSFIPKIVSNRAGMMIHPSNDDMNHSLDKKMLVDVDCNLLHPDLISLMHSSSYSSSTRNNTDEALQILHHPSTRQSGIVAMISPSSTVAESQRSVKALQSHAKQDICVRTTVGVHPYHALTEGPPSIDTVAKVRSLLNDPQSSQYISCIGEMGLDYSDGFPPKDHQLAWFKCQLDLAHEYDLPIFLHERLAFEDALRCIDEASNKHQRQGHPIADATATNTAIPKIIVHCFTGSYEQCREYMKRGYYTSISGYILKAGEGSDEVRRCLRDGIIPLERLMIETDAPYMGFAGCRDAFLDAEGESFTSLPSKKRKRLQKSIYPNVPSALPSVLEAVWKEINLGLEERGENTLGLEHLAKITTENAISFFNLE